MYKSAALTVFGLVLVATLVQIFVWGPQLPDRVAGHFGVNGVADGWMARGTFLLLMGGFQFGLAAMHLGIGALVGRLPVSMINMPNKEYWLSTERAKSSLDDLKALLYWVGALTAVLLCVLFQLTFRANALAEPRLDLGVFGLAMGVYFVALLALFVWTMKRFGKPPSSSHGAGTGHSGTPIEP